MILYRFYTRGIGVSDDGSAIARLDNKELVFLRIDLVEEVWAVARYNNLSVDCCLSQGIH